MQSKGVYMFGKLCERVHFMDKFFVIDLEIV